MISNDGSDGNNGYDHDVNDGNWLVCNDGHGTANYVDDDEDYNVNNNVISL